MIQSGCPSVRWTGAALEIDVESPEDLPEPDVQAEKNATVAAAMKLVRTERSIAETFC